MPRPAKITPAQLEQMLGKQTPPRVDTMHTYIQERQAHPDQYEKDPPGFAAVHHLSEPVPCRRCQTPTRQLVQGYGEGPCSITEPMCVECGERHKKSWKPRTKRARSGSKSTTRGTDLL